MVQLKKLNSLLQVPDAGTQVLDNTRPFLHSSIINFWKQQHILKNVNITLSGNTGTRNVPVFTNTGTFQYLGPEVYFFQEIQFELVDF